jgi:hypothetical protein
MAIDQRQAEEQPDILTATRESGIGAGLESAANLMRPSINREGLSLESAVTDFIEFSPIGDIKDAMSALDPTSPLGPVERGLALLPFAGGAMTIAGIQTAAQLKSRQRADAARQQLAQLPAADAAADPYMALPGEAPTFTPDEKTQIMSSTPTTGQYTGDAKNMSQRLFRRLMPDVADVFDTESYQDLAWYVVDKMDRPGLTAADGMDVELAGIGQRLAETEGWSVPEGVSQQDWEFSLAQHAIAAIVNAESQGLLDVDAVNPAVLEQRRKDWEQGKIGLVDLQETEARSETLLAHLATDQGSGFAIAAIADIFKALSDVGIGADLVGLPQFDVAKIIYDRVDGVGQARILFGFNEFLLPNQRTIDANSGTFYDIGGEKSLYDKMWAVQWATVLGEMAANHNLARERVNEQYGSKVAKHQRLWYRRANKTIRYLAEQTGIDKRKIAATFAAMSANTAWIPANLIGGIHYILEYGAGMDPTSQQYQEIAAQALREGQWGIDIMSSGTVGGRRNAWLAQADQNVEQAGELGIQYYSQKENILTKPNEKTGERKNMGATTERDVNSLDAIWDGDIPLNVLFRSFKFGNFYSSLAALAPTSYTMDVHQNRVAWGSMLMPSKKAITMEGGKRGKGERRAGFSQTIPGTRLTITGPDDFGAAYESMIANGMDPVKARALIKTAWENVPKEEDVERYTLLTEMARALYEQNPKWDNARMAQAETWLWSRMQSETLSEVEQGRVKDMFDPVTGEPILIEAGEKKGQQRQRQLGHADPERLENDAAYAELYRNNVSHSGIHDHLDGNPQLHPRLAALTTNVTTDTQRLPSPSAMPASATGNRRGAGQPVVLERMPDQSYRVWADIEADGVVDALPHLVPLPTVEVGGRVMMVPRKPRKVTSVIDHIKEVQNDVDPVTGMPVPVRTRVWQGSAIDLNGPGNKVLFEVDPDTPQGRQALISLSEELSVEPVATEAVGTTAQSATPLITATMLDDLSPEALQDEARSPFATHDWVSISSVPRGTTTKNAARHAELREKLVSAVQKQFGVDRATAEDAVMETDGRYFGDDEGSLTVFGLDYQTVFDLGKEFNQESVATRSGLMFMDGYFWPQDGGQYGATAVEQDNRSVITLPSGKATGYSMNYVDYRQEGLTDPRQLMFADGREQGSRFILLDFGTGYVQWQDIDQLIDRASRVEGVRNVTLYSDGRLWVNDRKFHAVDEYAYSDGVVTGTVRTAPGGHYASGHRRTAYVPHSELSGANQLPSGLVDGQRTREQAKAVMYVDEQERTVRFDRDLIVAYPLEAQELSFPQDGDIFAEDSTIDGAKVQRAVLDLNGEVPVMRPTADTGSFLAPDEGEVGTGLVQLQLGPGGVQISTTNAKDFADAATAVQAAGYQISDRFDQFGYHSRRKQLQQTDSALDLEKAANPRLSQMMAPRKSKDAMFTSDTPDHDAERILLEFEFEERIKAAGANPNAGVAIEAKSDMKVELLRGAVDDIGAVYGLNTSPRIQVAEDLQLSPALLGTAVRVMRFGILPGHDGELGRTFANRSLPGYKRNKTRSSGVQFDQRLWLVEEQMGRDASIASAGRDEVQHVIVHEAGHVIHQSFEFHGQNGQAYREWLSTLERLQRSKLGTATGISGYAQSSPQEYFAELYTEAVLRPENLTAEELRFVKASVAAANSTGEKIQEWYDIGRISRPEMEAANVEVVQVFDRVMNGE